MNIELMGKKDHMMPAYRVESGAGQRAGQRVGTGHSERGRILQSWRYGNDERLWANEGFKTVTDAQYRGILAHRGQWRPYNGRRRATFSPGIELYSQAA